MDVSFIEKEGLLLAVVDNLYTDLELARIKEELVFLNNPRITSLYSNKNRVARVDDGQPLQKSSSLFLDDFFARDRRASAILVENRKLFDDGLCSALEEKSAFFKHIRSCNGDTTLVNFYCVGDVYAPHVDASVFTALTFFDLHGTGVEGGKFFLPEYNVTLDPLDNRLVLFPGCVRHGSTAVTKGFKTSMAQFLNYNQKYI